MSVADSNDEKKREHLWTRGFEWIGVTKRGDCIDNGF